MGGNDIVSYIKGQSDNLDGGKAQWRLVRDWFRPLEEAAEAMKMSDVEDAFLCGFASFVNKMLRERSKSKWNRSMPFYEDILGEKARWDRARFLGFGGGTSIYQSSYVYGDVKVGHHTWIGPFTILDGTGGLQIGSYCSIASGVQIYTHESSDWALSGGKAKYTKAPVRIGNCCYMGSSTVVRMGVKIGDHVLVGAHSFVGKSIPDNSIAAGCPARVVGKVEVQGAKVKLKYTTRRSRTAADRLLH